MSLSKLPPKMVVCVGAVVLRQQQALFVRQTYGYYNGQWSIPWGFVCDDDGHPQHPEVAAVNEVRAEAGITAVVEGLLGIQNNTHLTGERSEPWVYLLFQCRHQAGEPKPDGYETDAAAYLSPGEIINFSETIEPFSRWLALRALQGQTSLILPNGDNPYPPHLAFL